MGISMLMCLVPVLATALRLMDFSAKPFGGMEARSGYISLARRSASAWKIGVHALNSLDLRKSFSFVLAISLPGMALARLMASPYMDGVHSDTPSLELLNATKVSTAFFLLPRSSRLGAETSGGSFGGGGDAVAIITSAFLLNLPVPLCRVLERP